MVNVTLEQEAFVGLRTVNLRVVREGARRWTGTEGHSVMSCFTHRESLDADRAAAVYAAIPQAVKDTPGNADLAFGISQLALLADEVPPDGCVNFLNAQIPPLDPPQAVRDKPYIFPGGFCFHTAKDADNFILFLANNQDAGHQVKWRNMTGQEQFEWYLGFKAARKTPGRNVFTVGLRGTDLGRLTTAAQLHAAAVHSPSLASRIPANHPVPVAQRPAVRALEF